MENTRTGKKDDFRGANLGADRDGRLSNEDWGDRVQVNNRIDQRFQAGSFTGSQSLVESTKSFTDQAFKRAATSRLGYAF